MILQEGRLIEVASPDTVFARGHELIKMGLDLPFVEKLRLELKEQGIQVPNEYLTEEEMIQWLSQSYLTK